MAWIRSTRNVATRERGRNVDDRGVRGRGDPRGTTWRCSLLAPELLDDLDGVITALRRVATSGPVFGMLAVDDEFFVIVRPVPGGASLLLSDATAGLDYDIAADVLDLLQFRCRRTTRSRRRRPWPEGDLALLADLGGARAGDAADRRRRRAVSGRAAGDDRAAVRVRRRVRGGRREGVTAPIRGPARSSTTRRWSGWRSTRPRVPSRPGTCRSARSCCPRPVG